MSKIKIKKEDYNRTANLEQKMKFFHRYNAEFGDIIVLKDPKTRQEIMMKQKELESLEEFASELHRTINRSNFTHPNLLKFVDYSTISTQEGGFYDSKIRLFYEYHQNTIKSEISIRKKNGYDFASEEITYLFYDMIEACAYLENKGVSHGDLCPEIILLSEEGKFVLGDKLRYKARFPQNLIDRYIRNRNLYVSPEVFDGIKKRDSRELENLISYKSDVFVMGLCFLEVGILFEPTKIFEKTLKKVDSKLLEKFILNFETRYGNNYLVCSILRKMLEIDPINRPSFLDLKYALPNREDIEKYFFPLRSNKKRPMKINRNLNTNPNSLNTTQVSNNNKNLVKDQMNFFDQNIQSKKLMNNPINLQNNNLLINPNNLQKNNLLLNPNNLRKNNLLQNPNNIQKPNLLKNPNNFQKKNSNNFPNQNFQKQKNPSNLHRNKTFQHSNNPFHAPNKKTNLLKNPNQYLTNRPPKTQTGGLNRNQSFNLKKPQIPQNQKRRQTDYYQNHKNPQNPQNPQNLQNPQNNQNFNNPLKRNFSHKKSNSNFIYNAPKNGNPQNSRNTQQFQNKNLLRNFQNDLRKKSNSFHNSGYNSNRVIKKNNKSNKILNMKTHKKNVKEKVERVVNPPLNVLKKKTYKKQKSNFQIFD